MSLKKKFGLGIASAALGLSLIGGGTYAYFSDVETTNNTFAAGTLDLSVDPSVIVNVSNIKPGDLINKAFLLKNDGSLDIASVLLSTNYTVTDANGNNTDDFGKHIRVNFLDNIDKEEDWGYNDVIYSTTLYDLKNTTIDAVEKKIIQGPNGEGSGMDAGTDDLMYVEFEFVDNGQDQNQYQGDSLQLEWRFDARQEAGERIILP